MRRDARERRDALVVAAHDCFRESGYLVPLEDIAARAGVGRGTLYRNFPDRLTLAIAVFEREIVLLAAEPQPDDDPLALMERLILRSARPASLACRLLGEISREHDVDERFRHVDAQAIRLWQPLIRRAKEAGAIRADVRVEDVLLLSRLMGGMIAPDDSDAAIAQVVRPLWRLLMEGLRPRA